MARWLIVEDDPDDQLIFQQALEQLADIEAVMLSSGDELLDRLENGDVPDLIFLDLDLPDVSGTEIIAEIREVDATATLPILILSSNTSVDRVDHAYRNGANTYFAKPPTVDETVELFRGARDHWSRALPAH